MGRKCKDNRVPWMGRIPRNWSSNMLGNLFVPRKDRVSDKDYPPLSVGKMGVVPQLETAIKTIDGDTRKLVKEGDFVINSRSGRRGSCGVSNYITLKWKNSRIFAPVNRMSNNGHLTD